jgi:pentatricopeptide repeat protein
VVECGRSAESLGLHEAVDTVRLRVRIPRSPHPSTARLEPSAVPLGPLGPSRARQSRSVFVPLTLPLLVPNPSLDCVVGRAVYDEMLANVKPDIETFVVLIQFASRSRDVRAAQAYFDAYHQHCVPLPVHSPRHLLILNLMLSVLSWATHPRAIEQLQTFFDTHLRPPPLPSAADSADAAAATDSRAIADVVSYNTLLGAYARRGRWDRVHELWRTMKQYVPAAPPAATASDADAQGAAEPDADAGADAAPSSEDETQGPATAATTAAAAPGPGRRSIAPNPNSYKTILSAVLLVSSEDGRQPLHSVQLLNAGRLDAAATANAADASALAPTPLLNRLQHVLPFIEDSQFASDEKTFALLLRAMCEDHIAHMAVARRSAPPPPSPSAAPTTQSSGTTPLGLSTPLRTRLREASEPFARLIHLVHRMRQSYHMKFNEPALLALGTHVPASSSVPPFAHHPNSVLLL